MKCQEICKHYNSKTIALYEMHSIHLNPIAFGLPCGGELKLRGMLSMVAPPLGDMRPTEAQLLSSPVRSEAAESARWLLRFCGLPFPRPFFLMKKSESISLPISGFVSATGLAIIDHGCLTVRVNKRTN